MHWFHHDHDIDGGLTLDVGESPCCSIDQVVIQLLLFCSEGTIALFGKFWLFGHVTFRVFLRFSA
eukprot:m.171397 g.171397  ORF g.171397 m.171397 type:complete len:65 (+) comp31648_c1_seq4:1122-1316(+)